MANYRKTRKLSVADAAYIAGIIDGEGTVTLQRRHKNENRHLVVSVANTDMRLLQYLLAVVGTGKITRKRTTSPLHTPSATWSVSNRQAYDLLAQLVEYLKTCKYERTRLVLDHYLDLTPRNGYYTAELKAEREQFVAEFFRIQGSSASNT